MTRPAFRQYDLNQRLAPFTDSIPMNIKNYTSVVPAMNSSAAIEALLVEAGATSVSKWYEEKQLGGFLFQLPIGGVPMVFRLPAKVELVYQAMLKKARNPDATKRASIRAQAQRTAWRTLHEWVQIQVTMILLEQIDPLQVFLSYHYDETTGRTFYDQVRSGSVKLLG
jgi:hypothetical protein